MVQTGTKYIEISKLSEHYCLSFNFKEFVFISSNFNDKMIVLI